MEAKLQEIHSRSDKEKRTEGYSTLLYNAFVTKDIQGLKIIFDHCKFHLSDTK